MSLSIVTALQEHAQVNSTELFVLLTIARHLNRKAGCPHAWPGYGRLAQLTRLDERTVKRTVKRLLDTPYLLVTPGAGPKGANVYTVVWGWQKTTAQMLRCGNCNLRGVVYCPPNLELELEEKKKKKEIAHIVPKLQLLEFLGLKEGSEVYTWCLNGHAKAPLHE